MRYFKVFNITMFLAAFGAGYIIRGSEFKQPETTLAQAEQTAVMVSNTAQNAGMPKPEQLDRIIRLAQQSQRLASKQTPSLPVSTPSPQAAFAVSEQTVESIPTGDLLGALDSKLMHKFDQDAIRNSLEFQQLIAQLQADPAARNQIISQFLQTSGTPLGQTLSEILAMSGGLALMPELKATAEQLLQNGSSEQQFNALQLLGSAAGNDPQLRTQVLEVIRKNSDSNPRLTNAAISSLNRQGVSSQTEHQEVIQAVSPLASSSDPEVRRNSLQILTQWTGKSQDTLPIFTQATQDSDPSVRSLAISALGNGSFSYENVREPLLATLQNPNEDPGVKAAAQQALSSFPLDEQALKIYQDHLAILKDQSTSGGVFN